MAMTTSRGAGELAAPLDLLLTSSAMGVAQRMMPNTSWSRFVFSLVRRPGTVGSRAAGLGRELVAIAEGRSDVAPGKGDRRFARCGFMKSEITLKHHNGGPAPSGPATAPRKC